MVSIPSKTWSWRFHDLESQANSQTSNYQINSKIKPMYTHHLFPEFPHGHQLPRLTSKKQRSCTAASLSWVKAEPTVAKGAPCRHRSMVQKNLPWEFHLWFLCKASPNGCRMLQKVLSLHIHPNSCSWLLVSLILHCLVSAFYIEESFGH